MSDTARPVTIERSTYGDWETYCHPHGLRILSESWAAAYELAMGHLCMEPHDLPACAHATQWHIGTNNQVKSWCLDCGTTVA